MLLCGDHTLAAERRGIDIAEPRESLVCIRTAHGFTDVSVGAGTEHAVDFGQLLQYLFAVALGQASRNHDAAQGMIFLQPSDVENVVDGLLFGALDKRAGIDDDDVGVDVLRNDFEAFRGKLGEHNLRIDKILRTAERDKSNFDSH